MFLWAKVNSDRNPNIVRQLGLVQVAHTQPPKGFVVTKFPKGIYVSATGPQSALRLLEANQLKPTVELSDVQLGVHSVRVSYTIPREVNESVRLSPKEVEIGVEAIGETARTLS